MDSIKEKTVNSSFVENMVEHVFISEMLQEVWINRNNGKVEILRAEVDDSGYDIILSWGNTNRYIQLKTSEIGGKTIKQKFNIALAAKENACVIWIIREIDNQSKRFKFKYLFFGSPIGQPFPDIEKYKTARHTKGNAKGEKKERPNIREIPKKDFVEYDSCSKLFEGLFKK